MLKPYEAKIKEQLQYHFHSAYSFQWTKLYNYSSILNKEPKDKGRDTNYLPTKERSQQYNIISELLGCVFPMEEQKSIDIILAIILFPKKGETMRRHYAHGAPTNCQLKRPLNGRQSSGEIELKIRHKWKWELSCPILDHM